MTRNRYQFEDRRNLSPGELFFWIALDQTKRQLGFTDLAAAATWLLGNNEVPISGKMKTATEGTSVLSIFFRHVIKYRTSRPLPTVTWVTLRQGRFLYTKSLGAWVGRAIPVLDIVLFGYDATTIIYRSLKRYDAIVKPEDRAFG